MSLEVTDFMKSLDSVIEYDNRVIGQQQMQTAVLRWAVSVKDLLIPVLRESLVAHMEQQLEQTKAQRPKVTEGSAG